MTTTRYAFLRPFGSLKSIGLVSFAIALASATTASAALQYSNLEKDPFATGVGVVQQGIYATSFTTGSEEIQLGSVVFPVLLDLNNTHDIPDYQLPSLILYLFKADADGLPIISQPVSNSFSYDHGAVSQTALSDLTFTANDLPLLEANTSYSFLIHLEQNGFQNSTYYYFGLTQTNDGTLHSEPSDTGWTIYNTILFDATGSGTSFTDAGGGNYNYAPLIALYSIPEPSTYALIGAALALAAVAIVRRRK